MSAEGGEGKKMDAPRGVQGPREELCPAAAKKPPGAAAQ